MAVDQFELLVTWLAVEFVSSSMAGCPSNRGGVIFFLCLVEVGKLSRVLTTTVVKGTEQQTLVRLKIALIPDERL